MNKMTESTEDPFAFADAFLLSKEELEFRAGLDSPEVKRRGPPVIVCATASVIAGRDNDDEGSIEGRVTDGDSSTVPYGEQDDKTKNNIGKQTKAKEMLHPIELYLTVIVVFVPPHKS